MTSYKISHPFGTSPEPSFSSTRDQIYKYDSIVLWVCESILIVFKYFLINGTKPGNSLSFPLIISLIVIGIHYWSSDSVPIGVMFFLNQNLLLFMASLSEASATFSSTFASILVIILFNRAQDIPSK